MVQVTENAGKARGPDIQESGEVIPISCRVLSRMETWVRF